MTIKCKIGSKRRKYGVGYYEQDILSNAELVAVEGLFKCKVKCTAVQHYTRCIIKENVYTTFESVKLNTASTLSTTLSTSIDPINY
jgi:hypothetical protein